MLTSYMATWVETGVKLTIFTFTLFKHDDFYHINNTLFLDIRIQFIRTPASFLTPK